MLRVAGAWEYAQCAKDNQLAEKWSENNFVRNRVLKEVCFFIRKMVL